MIIYSRLWSNSSNILINAMFSGKKRLILILHHSRKGELLISKLIKIKAKEKNCAWQIFKCPWMDYVGGNSYIIKQICYKI